MRLVVQRVIKASVEIDDKIISEINRGLLVFLGIHAQDNEDSINFLIDKLIHLRIFSDEQNKMNKSVIDIEGEILLVSQFTLYANCLKGRRPSFIEAKEPLAAKNLYDIFFYKLKNSFKKTVQGEFAADMKVSLINDGPITIIFEK